MNNKQPPDSSELLAMGKKVIEIERAALDALIPRMDESFATACTFILACRGRVVVTGMGKSGHIGNKIAATLASTGTPAFYVHPGEASHGDLGMITRDDVVVALSNSGETAEVISLVPLIKRLGVPLISMTGKPKSTLSRESNVHLDVSVEQEACPLNLAPTASTTATLAMGDALAVALLEARGFTEADFAMTHPGGSLGRKLLLKIADIMHSDERVPMVLEEASLSDALMEISRKGFGLTAIVDADKHLLGVFTDGDLRRVIDQNIDVRSTRIAEVMHAGGIAANADQLAAEAVHTMEKHKITALLIVNNQRQVTGVLHMHDLLRAGVV